jgi:hypothetical protein
VERARSNSKVRAINDLILKFTDIELLETVHKRKYGLGSVTKANFRDQIVACRIIKFDRISRYDLEGLSKDIEEVT